MARPPSLDQTARFQDHHDDQSKPEEEPPPDGEIHGRQRADPESAAKRSHPMGELGEKDPVKQGNNDASGNDAADRSHAAEDHHAQQHDRYVEFKGTRRDGLKLGRVDGAGEAGEGRPQGKGQEVGFDGVYARARGRRLVFADGHPGPAQARLVQSVHRPDRNSSDYYDQEVPGDRAGFEGHAEKMWLPDWIDAVLAAREIEAIDRPPVADLNRDVTEVSNGDRDNFTERQRDDGEVVASHTKRGHADGDTEDGRHDGA